MQTTRRALAARKVPSARDREALRVASQCQDWDDPDAYADYKYHQDKDDRLTERD